MMVIYSKRISSKSIIEAFCVIFVFLNCIHCVFNSAEAQAANSPELPIGNQLQILSKILSTNNRFKNANEVIIGIVYQSNNKASNTTQRDIISYANKEIFQIGKAVVKFIPIDISLVENNNISKALGHVNCDILIVTQIRSVNFKEITNYTKEQQCLSYSTHSDLMRENNLSMSIGYKGYNPQIFINPNNAQTEGFSFPPQILRLMQTIRNN